MFGWGSRQRKIQAAEMDRTGAIAESIAQDKELTKKLLDAAGVPVPRGRTASDAEATPGPGARDRPAGRHQAEGRQPGQGRDRQHHTRNS
jgi:hypothetical protein